MLTRKKKILFLSFLIFINVFSLFISLVYKYLFDISDGAFFECRFYSLFGYLCMGCGGSRSLIALLDFKPIRSFIYYPAIPVTAALLLFTDIFTVVSRIKKDGLKTVFSIGYKPFLLIPIFILLNFLIKNLFLLFGYDLFTIAEKIPI